MTRRVRLHEAASEEAIEAAAWYERQCPGLGADFHRVLQEAFDLLEGNLLPVTPAPGAAGRRGAKRLVLKRFPYDVVIADRGAEIVVVAVAHHSRRPGYWRRRLHE